MAILKFNKTQFQFPLSDILLIIITDFTACKPRCLRNLSTLYRTIIARSDFDNHVTSILDKGAKVDWDFWISDLVKNPDGTDFNPCGEFR